MKVWLISDTHFNHHNITTYCKRPPDFTEILIKRWHETVQPDDLVLHLGDVMIGKKSEWIMPSLPGRKILVMGNHDRSQSATWWMMHGFDFACQGLVFRNVWLTHEPSNSLAGGCDLNVHGHLHNFQAEVHPNYKPKSFHRLFAVEYTDYRPVEFDKFISHPDRYQANIFARNPTL